MGGRGAAVIGQGTVAWTLHSSDGSLRTLHLKAYHIPNATQRLLSTSVFHQTYNDETITSAGQGLVVSGSPNDPSCPPLCVFNNPTTRLPTSTAYLACNIETPGNQLVNAVSTVSADNSNLSEGQKELLRWHQRLGHLSFLKIQHLMRTGVLSHTAASRSLHTAASKISKPPRCAACIFGKQTVRSAPGTKHTTI